MELEVGLTGTYRSTVMESDSAHAQGNPGVYVLSTPRLVEFCERAVDYACSPDPKEDDLPRRMRVDIRHLAATRVGDDVDIRAELAAIDGDRLMFDVSGTDSRGKIVSGRVERVRGP